ncbi:Ig-like domain-containing protein [Bremerella alba]|uniref:Carboxypeptidase regulatory-like domain-containing protein n=1 Tax=Bremerella alba TaxID=980252 RepID=A0A7V8V1Y9_9BACT|nr:Ig-like domain-containing protein [Bremerella alba]MBA2113457.1 hypothetical protein [Bremerella alba]
MNGEPLPDAIVSFYPQEARKNPSMGTTDSNGKYVLRFTSDKSGAIQGSYVVRIAARKDVEKERQVRKPVVPAMYNKDSILRVDVKGTSNTFDFDLIKE